MHGILEALYVNRPRLEPNQQVARRNILNSVGEKAQKLSTHASTVHIVPIITLSVVGTADICPATYIIFAVDRALITVIAVLGTQAATIDSVIATLSTDSRAEIDGTGIIILAIKVAFTAARDLGKIACSALAAIRRAEHAVIAFIIRLTATINVFTCSVGANSCHALVV